MSRYSPIILLPVCPSLAVKDSLKADSVYWNSLPVSSIDAHIHERRSLNIGLTRRDRKRSKIIKKWCTHKNMNLLKGRSLTFSMRESVHYVQYTQYYDINIVFIVAHTKSWICNAQREYI